MIELYSMPTPNGQKVMIMLEECGLEWKHFDVNIRTGDQFSAEHLKRSPNNKIPAIVDAEGPDGKPLALFESGAILIYLAGKTGFGLPDDVPRRYDVLQWLMWQMGGFGPMPGQVHHFLQVADPADRKYGLERYMNETRRLYGVLDRRLAGREYVVDECSIADFAILGWAWRHERHKVDLADFPNVRAWYERCMARPATRRGFEVALS